MLLLNLIQVVLQQMSIDFNTSNVTIKPDHEKEYFGRKKISIHLMLLLNVEEYEYIACGGRFQYI